MPPRKTPVTPNPHLTRSRVGRQASRVSVVRDKEPETPKAKPGRKPKAASTPVKGRTPRTAKKEPSRVTRMILKRYRKTETDCEVTDQTRTFNDIEEVFVRFPDDESKQGRWVRTKRLVAVDGDSPFSPLPKKVTKVSRKRKATEAADKEKSAKVQAKDNEEPASGGWCTVM